MRGVLRCFFLLSDGAQHIAGAGDVRQIDLGLDFVLEVGGGTGWFGRGARLGGAAEPLTHELSFVFLKRAGMRFFLSDADLGQHVKNSLALDLQLTGQIIDSNLHPLSVSSSCPAWAGR